MAKKNTRQTIHQQKKQQQAEKATTTATPSQLPESKILVKEDGTVSFPMAVLLVGVVLIFTGRKYLGISFFAGGILLAACNAAMEQIPEQDRQDIRYNIMTADDVVKELLVCEMELIKNATNNDDDDERARQKCRIHCISGLEALAKKFATQQRKLKIMAQKENSSSNAQQNNSNTPANDVYKQHYLELLCQQAAYVAYRLFPTNEDQVVAAALSLHALVAKDPQVRQRHLFEADEYGLDKPVQCMRKALLAAKEETDEDKEQQAAELQRKACLLLGALADGDADVATKIVEEDGLEAVLDTMDWYRYHEDVANWALWAVFILSYENPPNKVQNVELGGVPIIIQTMKKITECRDVARHGIAVLFDLMRDDQNVGGANGSLRHQHLDVWQIRKTALAAGLHGAVLGAMVKFSDTIDIIMMGGEILAGTDYRGSVPEYQPREEDLAPS